MRFPQGWELVVLLLVVLVLFGSKRLPDAARGLGRSLRIFKSEVNEMREDGADPARSPSQPLPPADPDTPGRPEGADPTTAPQEPRRQPGAGREPGDG